MEIPAQHERISSEAIQWFLKLEGTLLKAADREDFSEWLTRSPAHIREFLAVSSAWGALDIADEGAFSTEALIAGARESCESDNIVQLSQRRTSSNASPVERRGRLVRIFSRGVVAATAKPRGRRLAWRFSRGMLAAAAACLVVGLITWTVLRPVSDAGFMTAVGEQRSVTLRDGSVMFLNTDSKVRVRWRNSERRVDLIRGEARFRVASNVQRPFVVMTARAAVRVLGTIFNVRTEAQSTQVTVMEGQVEVLAATPDPQATFGEGRPIEAAVSGAAVGNPLVPSIRLGAGERAAVTIGGIEPNTGPSLESVAALTERRLVFRDESLDAVVSEFNRYRTRPLVLDDPQLGALKISGAFDLTDPESLIAYPKNCEAVKVGEATDGSEHLSRSSPPK